LDVRQILHWLVDAVSKPDYQLAGQPGPDQVRQAVDDAFGYVKPEAALAPEEEAQLNALLAKQRDFDAQNAAAKAGVEQHNDAGA
jgi:hypothetical protein